MFTPFKILAHLLAALFSFSIVIAAEDKPEPATTVQDLATVNGKKITSADVERALRMRYGPSLDQMPAEQRANAIKQVTPRMAEELISRSLLLEAARAAKATASADELKKTIEQIKGSLPPGVKFEEYIKKMGHTEKSFEAEVTEELLINFHVQEILSAVKAPTDAELQKYYQENKESFNSKESITASHILLKTDPGSDEKVKSEKLKAIQKLREQLITAKGDGFDKLAKEHSDCPSSARGGDLGSFGRGQMVPAFEKAAFTQKVGDVGDVVETQFGYHLIKVTKKTKAGQRKFEEVKEDISRQLDAPKRQKTMQDYISGLESKAKITRSPAIKAKELPSPEKPKK
ncbi:MAG: peptidylprolyl isomerase [Verrucomicrobiota bacterium]|nr:peptidylprolyl isomerase [Verrucomicrobiota bacterium]